MYRIAIVTTLVSLATVLVAAGYLWLCFVALFVAAAGLGWLFKHEDTAPPFRPRPSREWGRNAQIARRWIISIVAVVVIGVIFLPSLLITPVVALMWIVSYDAPKFDPPPGWKGALAWLDDLRDIVWPHH